MEQASIGPACISTLEICVAGAASSGGVTAVMVGKFPVMSGMRGQKSSAEKSNQKERTCQKQPTSK